MQAEYDTQAEYEQINRDLDRLLRATSLEAFATLHTGLRWAIENIFAALDEPDMTIGVVQTIAENMKNRIVCRPHHIFYVRVMFVTDSTENQVQVKRQLQPVSYKTEENILTFNYLIQNNCVYTLDVTNLCTQETPPLYLYDRDVSRAHNARFTETHWALPNNPFLLSPPPPMPARMFHIFPGAVRLDAVRLTHNWRGHDYELREADETVVVRMQFRVMSAHGKTHFDAAPGIPLLLARLTEQK